MPEKSAAPKLRPSMNQMLELSRNIRAAERGFNDLLKQAEAWDIRVEFKTEVTHDNVSTAKVPVGISGHYVQGPAKKRLLVKKIAVEI